MCVLFTAFFFLFNFVYETQTKEKNGKLKRLARDCPILFFLASASRVENQK